MREQVEYRSYIGECVSSQWSCSPLLDSWIGKGGVYPLVKGDGVMRI